MSATATTILSHLELTLDEHPTVVKVRPFPVKDDPERTWWCIAKKKKTGERYPSWKYGANLPAMSDRLPTVADFHGFLIPLEPGVTASGNPKMSGTALVLIDDVEMKATVAVSRVSDTHWCIRTFANRPGGGGGSQNMDYDDL